MQQRRLRPGDVLDDYCPRERRVTDHAIVAMIDDTIQQTRCVVCDAEHEYKEARVPAQRKKNAPALFTQVLDGLKAPHPPSNGSDSESLDDTDTMPDEPTAAAIDPPVTDAEPMLAAGDSADAMPLETPGDAEPLDAPLFRRRLIRAALPRPEGVQPPARAIPEFTMRQPTGRGHRHRRRGNHQQSVYTGPMRFGRDDNGPRSNGHGRPSGNGNGHGAGANGNRARGPRRRKKR